MSIFSIQRWFFIALFTMACAATANAAPPAHAGKPGKHAPPGLSKHAGPPGHAYYQRHEYQEARTADVLADMFFNERRIAIIHDYYHGMFSRGHCPPGLAKKHNGCMPPGQAKKWRIGHRLPEDVIYYGLPPELLERLEYDSPAYKLIRVGTAILRIEKATGVVVDALDELF